MKEKTALLAFHDEGIESMFQFRLEVIEKYGVKCAHSVEEMLELMGIPPDSPPNQPPSNHFDLYAMDVNLRRPGYAYYEPAEIIYGHIKELVKNGKVIFVPNSATPEAVEAANKAGIPSYLRLAATIDEIYAAMGLK